MPRGELFRGHGIDAVGVDAIMHRAGLTHGGFYAHFASKEALVAEVSAAVPGALGRPVGADQRGSRRGDRAAAYRRKLPRSRRTSRRRNAGCVLTTLGPEVARRRARARRSPLRSAGWLDVLARCLPWQAAATALAALSGMVGAVVLARLSDDPELADELLAATKQAAFSR